MPRLNNKDYTEIELERLIFLADVLANDAISRLHINEADPVIEEVKALIAGSQFTNFEGEKLIIPIPWNFKFEFKMLINAETQETADMIKRGMRSSEVNENIKKRFSAIVREEINWHMDRVKYFMVKGGTNISEGI